jgi:hypothetical protein
LVSVAIFLLGAVNYLDYSDIEELNFSSGMTATLFVLLSISLVASAGLILDVHIKTKKLEKVFKTLIKETKRLAKSKGY